MLKYHSSFTITAAILIPDDIQYKGHTVRHEATVYAKYSVCAVISKITEHFDYNSLESQNNS